MMERALMIAVDRVVEEARKVIAMRDETRVLPNTMEARDALGALSIALQWLDAEIARGHSEEDIAFRNFSRKVLRREGIPASASFVASDAGSQD
jgi:hypothetical protein